MSQDSKRRTPIYVPLALVMKAWTESCLEATSKKKKARGTSFHQHPNKTALFQATSPNTRPLLIALDIETVVAIFGIA